MSGSIMWLRIYCHHTRHTRYVVDVHVGELGSQMTVIHEQHDMNQHVDVGEGQHSVLDDNRKSRDGGALDIGIDEECWGNDGSDHK